jgi:hypothetical protein|tara:strand:+ start:191 stop:652 length:462 start_codon:yes stop_codon:yes gene_type:complete
MTILKRTPGQRYLFAALILLLLQDAAADKYVQPPTFGEQMHEVIQAHDRGEITYREMMERRRTLSEQFGNKPIENPIIEMPDSSSEVTHQPTQATDNEVRKSAGAATDNEARKSAGAETVEATPAPGKPVYKCSGLRKFTLKCLRRPYPHNKQ